LLPGEFHAFADVGLFLEVTVEEEGLLPEVIGEVGVVSDFG